MAILVDKNTRVLVQGLTGREGTFHAKASATYGTQIVAGVTPGKGGTRRQHRLTRCAGGSAGALPHGMDLRCACGVPGGMKRQARAVFDLSQVRSGRGPAALRQL